MQEVFQAPVRAPPPLPVTRTLSESPSEATSQKVAIRVVDNETYGDNHDTSVEDKPVSSPLVDDLKSTVSPSYPSLNKLARMPRSTSERSSHELEEPAHPLPPLPPQHDSSGHVHSSSLNLDLLSNHNDSALGTYRSDSPRIVLPNADHDRQSGSRNVSNGSNFSADSNESGAMRPESGKEMPADLMAELHYHHRPLSEAYISGTHRNHSPQSLSLGLQAGPREPKKLSAASNLRPMSSYSSLESGSRGRSGLPGQATETSTVSPSRRSQDSRPISYINLLNVPYPQPAPAPINLDNAHLRTSVGNNASLLSPLKTLEMYRANVKKTNDSTVLYSFAIFMLETAQEAVHNPAKFSWADSGGSEPNPAELVKEARQILQKLSDRSYPFAQYYLADGYASGLFNKGREDNDRAFPLFVAASKHGHVEAGYRAALSYEFGWGTRKDPLKAVQFYRQSASKNHPGAMTRLARACLTGDLGLEVRYKEGIKWLKRATESADEQYNTAPYELGMLHETGYGDDVFLDEQYAAQLFTQAADLGHLEANFKLGDAYEHGKLGCPKDPALSIHFYNGAASRGYAPAEMALCAWYMVGAEPVLVRDEGEAYEWAKKAAETGKRPSCAVLGW